MQVTSYFKYWRKAKLNRKSWKANLLFMFHHTVNVDNVMIKYCTGGGASNNTRDITD